MQKLIPNVYGLKSTNHTFAHSFNLLDDYVSDRKQKVVVNNECSNPNTVKAGVPQGLVLGPLLFLLYGKFQVTGKRWNVQVKIQTDMNIIMNVQ
jgi:hypothetical protein